MQYSQLNAELNSYLTIPGQYQYKENPNELRQLHNNNGAYSLQKTKKFQSLRHMDEPERYSLFSQKEDEKEDEFKKGIILKSATIQNILHDNPLHLRNSTNCARRIEPPNPNVDFDEVKQRCFLESKDSPEYMRIYDKEKLPDLDKYYAMTNQNQQYLSRFGDWITLPPGCRDRSKALEKLSHGTYETSILAPKWMNIRYSSNDRVEAKKNSPFKLFQWENKCRDNTRVTYLVEKDQKKAKPMFLCDSYERYGSTVPK